MKISEFENKHNVNLVLKNKSRFMRIVGFFLGRSFMENFWTTFRLFGQRPTITFPESNDLTKYDEIPPWAFRILNHEMFHAEYMRSTFGLIKSLLFVSIFPLPIIFSGRWFIEKYAYLDDIKAGWITVDYAAEILWKGYGWCWPKPLMRRWFNKKLRSQ